MDASVKFKGFNRRQKLFCKSLSSSSLLTTSISVRVKPWECRSIPCVMLHWSSGFNRGRGICGFDSSCHAALSVTLFLLISRWCQKKEDLITTAKSAQPSEDKFSPPLNLFALQHLYLFTFFPSGTTCDDRRDNNDDQLNAEPHALV